MEVKQYAYMKHFHQNTETLCIELTAPTDGNVAFHTTSQLIEVGTDATYYCDPGYSLVGEKTRTCKNPSKGTLGIWNGHTPRCKTVSVILNS